MKGIILAAGKGTRLYPMTRPVPKPLLPVFDKPMIYYCIATLLKAEICDILVITPPGETKLFSDLLGDGSRLGISISYKEQPVQRGIADAFMIGEDFIGKDDVCLILGDNIFIGEGLPHFLQEAKKNNRGATIFGYPVADPRAFGVVAFDENHHVTSIEEKPEHPKSNYIVPGLYFYNNKVIAYAKEVAPSARGELEITSVNNRYLEEKNIDVILLDETFQWLDAGTCSDLLCAAEVVAKAQEAGGYVACIEEAAYENGYITKEQLKSLGEEMKATNYGQYILSLLEK